MDVAKIVVTSKIVTIENLILSVIKNSLLMNSKNFFICKYFLKYNQIEGNN